MEQTTQSYGTRCMHIWTAIYDLKKVKMIYLNVDGGAWIQNGKEDCRDYQCIG